MRSLALILALVLTTLATGASAQTHDTQQPAVSSAETPHWQWYGWQTALAACASHATMAARNPDEDARPFFVGLTMWGLGSPVIHTAHGNWELGLLSFGLRVGFGIGAMFAAVAKGHDRWEHPSMEPWEAFHLVTLPADLIDVAIAFERTPSKAAPQPSTDQRHEPSTNGPTIDTPHRDRNDRFGGIQVRPLFAAAPAGWTAGIGVTF